MMLIYIPTPSVRVQYIFDFVLSETLGLDYELTSNRDFFISADTTIKWAYGGNIHDIPCLPAAPILWQTDIQQQILKKIVLDDIVAVFETDDFRGVNFDIFASSFYLLTRYEEYLPCAKDKHGRYAAIQSIAFQYGFLETAMVNRYILWFVRWLRNYFPSIDIRLNKPRTLVSIDIDHPFYMRDIAFSKWLKRSLKQMSFLGEKDKYDMTEYMLEKMEGLSSIFFILCPKNPSDMDHYNQRDSDAFRDMIQLLRNKTKIGLHPSYYAEERNLFSDEWEWLSAQHQKPIKSVRFHYLRFDVENTPQLLSNYNIQNDFSMGYGTHIGFRTSTSLPYYFFDLIQNRKTGLKIYTPCIMDSIFKHYGKIHFREHFKQLVDEINMYGGIFIPIFHNDIVAEEEWMANFEYSVALMKKIGS